MYSILLPSVFLIHKGQLWQPIGMNWLPNWPSQLRKLIPAAYFGQTSSPNKKLWFGGLISNILVFSLQYRLWPSEFCVLYKRGAEWGIDSDKRDSVRERKKNIEREVEGRESVWDKLCVREIKQSNYSKWQDIQFNGILEIAQPL